MRNHEIMAKDAEQICTRFMLEATPERIERIVESWQQSEKSGATTGPTEIAGDENELRR